MVNVVRPEDDPEIIRMWNLGCSTAEIGRALGRTKNAIVGRAHRIGCPYRPKMTLGQNFLPQEKADKARALLNNGMSNEHVARHVGIDPKTAARLRANLGVDPFIRRNPPARTLDVEPEIQYLRQATRERSVRVVVPIDKFSSIKTCTWVGGATGPDGPCDHRTVHGTSWCNDHGAKVFVRWPPQRQADAA